MSNPWDPIVPDNGPVLNLAEALTASQIVDITAVDSPYQAKHSENIRCDTSGGDIVVILPADPLKDRPIKVKLNDTDPQGEVDVQGNGNNINDDPNYLITIPDQSITLIGDGDKYDIQ